MSTKHTIVMPKYIVEELKQNTWDVSEKASIYKMLLDDLAGTDGYQWYIIDEPDILVPDIAIDGCESTLVEATTVIVIGGDK